MTYRVTAYRSTQYDVEAETEDEAIDKMIDGEAQEVHGETLRIEVQPLDSGAD